MCKSQQCRPQTFSTSIDCTLSISPAWAYLRRQNWRIYLVRDVRRRTIDRARQQVSVDTAQCQITVMLTWIMNIHKNGNSDVIGQHLRVFNWRSLKRLSHEPITLMCLPGPYLHALIIAHNINSIKKFNSSTIIRPINDIMKFHNCALHFFTSIPTTSMTTIMIISYLIHFAPNRHQSLMAV